MKQQMGVEKSETQGSAKDEAMMYPQKMAEPNDMNTYQPSKQSHLGFNSRDGDTNAQQLSVHSTNFDTA